MKISEIVSLIAKAEGKKSQVKVGNIREIVGILSDLLVKSLGEGDYTVLQNLLKNGEKRAKKKK
jgi:hypothetical protein